jgi:hypothetical protein
VSSFDPHVAADWSVIGAFAAIIIGVTLYLAGVGRPLKANAKWRATTHEELGQVVFVEATLKSRTRNSQVVVDSALVQDPGWPRRLRGRFRTLDLTRFHSSSVPATGLAIDGHQTVELKADLAGTSLPYGKTRLWIRAGKRSYYFKLKNWR